MSASTWPWSPQEFEAIRNHAARMDVRTGWVELDVARCEFCHAKLCGQFCPLEECDLPQPATCSFDTLHCDSCWKECHDCAAEEAREFHDEQAADIRQFGHI